MSNLDIVKEITAQFASNADDQAVLDRYFAPDFIHWANGREQDIDGYADHLERYERDYGSFRIPNWDEAFEAGDAVAVAYTLEAERKGRRVQRTPVMAIWHLQDGKVTSLREVEGADLS